MARVAKASSETRSVISQAGGKMTRANAAPMLIVRSISSPSSSFSGCRQLVLQGWDRGRDSRLQWHVNSVLALAIGISGDTERYISSGGPVPVLDRRSESFKGEIR